MEKSEGLDNLKHDEITECIFNQLHTELINRTDIEHIEVEVRLGWIKQTQQDFNNASSLLFCIPHGIILPPCPSSVCTFTSGIYGDHYNQLKQKFEEFSNAPDMNEENKELLLGLISKGDLEKFDPVEFQDTKYSKEVRVTTNLNNDIIKIIRKTKIKDIDYFNHGNDYRISISKELPMELDSLKSKGNKKLQSFKYKNLMFDFKEVTEVKKSKEYGPIYEVEIEITNLPELIKEGTNDFYNTVRLMVHFAGLLYYTE